jgi:hypothetical protein
VAVRVDDGQDPGLAVVDDGTDRGAGVVARHEVLREGEGDFAGDFLVTVVAAGDAELGLGFLDPGVGGDAQAGDDAVLDRVADGVVAADFGPRLGEGHEHAADFGVAVVGLEDRVEVGRVVGDDDPRREAHAQQPGALVRVGQNPGPARAGVGDRHVAADRAQGRAVRDVNLDEPDRPGADQGDEQRDCREHHLIIATRREQENPAASSRRKKAPAGTGLPRASRRSQDARRPGSTSSARTSRPAAE